MSANIGIRTPELKANCLLLNPRSVENKGMLTVSSQGIKEPLSVNTCTTGGPKTDPSLSPTPCCGEHPYLVNIKLCKL